MVAESMDPELDDAIASVERQFGSMFNRVRASMRERAPRVHPDLQPVGYKVLATLVRGGPQHAGRLAEVLVADKSLISRTIKQLEELNLVTRAPDPADRRASFVDATSEGRQRFEAVQLADKERLYERMREWKVNDVKRLADLLDLLNETLTS